MLKRAFFWFLLWTGAVPLPAQSPPVPTPESHFGFVPGADRKLANWDALSAYYEVVAQASPRLALDTLGTSTQGRPLVMFTITSPQNQARLPELLEIQRKLADPRRVESAAELAELKAAAKVVVLVTSHVHSTEVGAGQMPANLVYELATSHDPEIEEILDRVILLHIPSLNPDGTQLVSNWYQHFVGTRWEGAAPVELYHPYIGHDNNRDWYALTQVETELTVQHAHNVWRPMIVHDIHQMGATGARLFLPPYVEPFEANVDPLIIAAINQLGSYMAAELTMQGKTGVVTGAQYDLFTPARAYQHYHGGVRILSETASAQLASPVYLRTQDLRDQRGFRVNESSMNFPAPWRGGEWGLPQIVDYQQSAVLALLKNAARNRTYWIDNFYEINRRAIEGWDSWPAFWVIPDQPDRAPGLDAVLRILTLGSVEVHRARAGFHAEGRSFEAGSYVIPMQQPYASWAQTLLEVQQYPDLFDYPGGPPTRPYDVTAHTLPLLMGIEAVAIDGPLELELSEPIPPVEFSYAAPEALAGREPPRIGLYKGWSETIPAGWTRWLLDRHHIPYTSLMDSDLRRGDLVDRFDVIVFQDQHPLLILEGWAPGQQPPEYVGGIGVEGAAALRDFAFGGGRIIAIESASDLMIELFGLPVRNRVASLAPSNFYIPGSILRLDVDAEHPIGRAVERRNIAWFWRTSRAFDIWEPALGALDIEVVASYGVGDPRLSGWASGAGLIAGEPAIIEASVGRGSVVLFGFQPNYRGQSIASWPLLFNALDHRR